MELQKIQNICIGANENIPIDIISPKFKTVPWKLPGINEGESS